MEQATDHAQDAGLLRVVVIGAGPRGTSVVERLALAAAGRQAWAPADLLIDDDDGGALDARPLRIDVVDPYPAGSGRVWDPGQSRNLWMNTPSMFPTVAPERPAGVGRAEHPGLSFEQFRVSGGDGAELSEVERAELEALGPGSFPPRPLYGRYLQHVWEGVAAQLEGLDHVDGPHVHATLAVSVDPHVGGGYRVVLGSGQVLYADRVVLAVGHVPARISPEQEAVGSACASHPSAHYVPPHVSTDVDYDALPAGQNVLVRGMGLNFFDLMAEVTLSRGGRFEETGGPAGQALKYIPSGKEPILIAGSRRGTPYRAKAAIPAFIPPGIELKFFTYDRIVEAAEKGATGRLPGTVDFERHVWPLLNRDVIRTYYNELAAAAPEVFESTPSVFLDELDEILAAPTDIGDEVWVLKLKDALARALPDRELFDIRALARPWSGHGAITAEAYRAATIEMLESDVAAASLGTGSPLHMAIGALHAGRMIVKRLIAEGYIDERSVAAQVRGWFEPLVEGLASGPPLERIEQMVALVRAGIIEVLGPEPSYTYDAEARLFRAVSPWVGGAEPEATWMVEAMMPANRVAITDSPLLRSMLASGLARPRVRITDDGEQVPGSGLDVEGADHRVVGTSGAAADGVHVLGLQLSSVQWGTAIAAEAGGDPHVGARTLADAEAIARSVLLA
ncbi:FAD/NAD(P)-binding protein [Pseudoglutamicibacter cumminsii]|uniref:FAD/NAD(P)-binding protein n=1 Tax=Pseudoglutamicibacter cumminsii TaxID=156979 RepID=UPI002553A0EB|nr:FAD/NAD(P)-binding protein [Pseudoglutamicibacter cumminsii]MDK7083995.1 FAD/NAD(P)-binding protein [Pseudoglutamicibacter cumminsii]